MKKVLLVMMAILFSQCGDSVTSDTINQSSEGIGANGTPDINNVDITILETEDAFYSVGINFTSLSGGRALRIDYEDGLYNLNLYKSVSSTWIKQKNIYSDISLLSLRKAKNSDTFIIYPQTAVNNFISVYEASLDKFTTIEVGNIYTSATNKPLISPSGDRILICNRGTNKDILKIIQKEEDGTYSVYELSGIDLKRAFNVKFSGSFIVLKYLSSSNFLFNLFKIENDFSLTKELDINEADFAPQKYLERDMVLSDTMFAYLSDIDNFSATITIYKNNVGTWEEAGDVNILGWFNLNRSLDYYNDSFVFHGFKISPDSFHEIKTLVFNYEEDNWIQSKENIFKIEGGFTYPLMPHRISYDLNNAALDACMLIRQEILNGKMHYKNKCFSDKSFN